MPLVGSGTYQAANPRASTIGANAWNTNEYDPVCTAHSANNSGPTADETTVSIWRPPDAPQVDAAERIGPDGEEDHGDHTARGPHEHSITPELRKRRDMG